MFILFGKKGHSFSMKKIGCPYRIKNKKSGQCIIDLFSEDRYCSIHGEELGGMRQAVGLGALVEERLAIKTRVHSMYYIYGLCIGYDVVFRFVWRCFISVIVLILGIFFAPPLVFLVYPFLVL